MVSRSVDEQAKERRTLGELRHTQGVAATARTSLSAVVTRETSAAHAEVLKAAYDFSERRARTWTTVA
jgi:hypothetical protein